jgi:hypothetical protein
VPGAYYSDPASVLFIKLEQSLVGSGLGAAALGRLAGDLEQLLPSPTETEIEQAFDEVTERLGLRAELNGSPGKRVVLRMIVTIASTLSQPVIRESGVMRLPQTIKGLFDIAPREPPNEGSKSER